MSLRRSLIYLTWLVLQRFQSYGLRRLRCLRATKNATAHCPRSTIHNWRLALASAPEVILQTRQSSATGTTFAGLIPGQIYLVQVSVAGTAGTSDWSQSAILMVV